VADNPDVNKGQEFLSRSFIKNQAASNKENSPLTNAFSKNVNVFGGLAKQLTILNQNLNKMLTKPTEKKKDFVRREDPMKKLYLAVDDLEELMRESVNLQKEKEKKSKGLLGWVGTLMGLGGLLGYLLTGKEEMLFSVVKALTKYSPVRFLLGFVDDIIKKIAPKLFSGIGKLFGALGEMITKIPGVKKLGKSISNLGAKLIKPVSELGAKLIKPIAGIASKAVKPIIGMFKGISKIFAPLGKLFGGTLAKEGAKAGSKGLGKAFLKKIPVVGGLIGLFFGIQRFKKGDIVGGLLEIASGISSVVPVAGTAIGIGIDAFLLFRDFKTPKGEPPPQPNWGKMGMAVLKSLPGIGTFIHFKEAMGLWKTDKLGAMKEIALGLTSVIPGANLILDPVLSFIEGFIKDKGGIGKVAGKALQTAGEVIRHPIKSVGKLWESGKDMIKGAASKAGQAALEGSREYAQSGQEFLASAKSGYGGSMTSGGMASATSPISSNIGSNIKVTDLNSLKESIKQNEGLRLQAYPDSFGTSIGYGHFLGAGRGGLGKTITKEQAEAFFEQDFQKAYSAARQIPNFNNTPFSAQAAMIDMTYNMGPGWIKKFGKPGGTIEAISRGDFTKAAQNIRKTAYYSQVPKRAEQNIQRFLEASKGASTSGSSAIATASPIKSVEPEQVTSPQASNVNLPATAIGQPIQTAGMQKIELSDSTIQALAQAMGTSFKGSWPTQKSGSVSIDANMRG